MQGSLPRQNCPKVLQKSMDFIPATHFIHETKELTKNRLGAIWFSFPCGEDTYD